MVQHRTYTPARNDSRREAGLLLAAYRDRGYTMAVSEAGLLPFYSGWRAIDTWGLNDEEIARTGRLTEDYLELIASGAIVFDAVSSPTMPLRRVPDRWDAMALLLRDYAEGRGDPSRGVVRREAGRHAHLLRATRPARHRSTRGWDPRAAGQLLMSRAESSHSTSRICGDSGPPSFA